VERVGRGERERCAGQFQRRRREARPGRVGPATGAADRGEQAGCRKVAQVALRLLQRETLGPLVPGPANAVGGVEPRTSSAIKSGTPVGPGAVYAATNGGGRPIRVRYLWAVASADSCRWEQAFSTDRGETWETNWVADFTRAG
jgi:hypothetical protein